MATEKSKAISRVDVRDEVMKFYLANNNGQPPIIQCEETKGGILMWWLEPPLKNVPNYLVCEGDRGAAGWAIWIEEDNV